MVTEDQIQAILETSEQPQQAADRLVKAANRAGGIDNITIALARVGETHTVEAPETTKGTP